MNRRMAKQRQQMLEAKDFVDDLDKDIYLNDEEKELLYEHLTQL